MNSSTVLCAAYSLKNVGQSLPGDGSISPRHGCEEQNHYLRRCAHINLKERDY